MSTESFDVTVVGGGPGGYVAAIRAAQLGKKTALVERDRLGGVCLNWGCIPTKALLRMAEQYEFLREAGEWGFELEGVRVRWERIIERSRQAAERLSRGVEYLMRKYGVRTFKAAARCLTPHRIELDPPAGGVERIETTVVVLATGGRAALLPGVEADGERVITSKEAMILARVPESLAIVGGGAVGVEFAYFYSVFGTRVTLLEYCPGLLPGMDAEVSSGLARSFERRGIQLRLGSEVTGLHRTENGVRVEYRAGAGPGSVEADAALVAIGFCGNVEGIGLERIGVRTERGFIVTDEHCETDTPGVYAIGDVRGPPMLAHVASREGVYVAERAAGLAPQPIDYSAIPACIYTQPQVASVGLSEEEARERGLEVRVARFPFSANGKAVAAGETEGFVKIIADARHGEILGAHILGAEATELIAELALAKAAELTVEELHNTVHAHPTLSECVQEAAALWSGAATQI